jgi:hypothetical protein
VNEIAMEGAANYLGLERQDDNKLSIVENHE